MADVKVDTRKTTVASRTDSSGRYDNTNTPLESDLAHLHPLVSWRSIVGGLFVAVLTLATLLSLGMAFGGIGLMEGSSIQGAGIFTGIWFLASAIISLFAGSYFAARISKFHTNRIGAAQGLVIASLFFGLFLWQTAQSIGWVGGAVASGAQSVASGAATGANAAADNPVVQNVMQDLTDDLNLRAEPNVVISGVATRLLRGNVDGARNYLARMSGITQAEAERRITEARAQVDQALVQARESTARALQATGWTLFATLVLGSAAAIGGGALGSRANMRRPLTHEQAVAISDYGTASV